MAILMNYNSSSKAENQLLDYIFREYKGGDLTPEKARAVECILQDFFKQFPDSNLTPRFMKRCIGFYSKPCTMRGTAVHTSHFVRGDQTTIKKVETEFQGYLEAYGSLINTEFEGGVFAPLNLCFTPINTQVFSVGYQYILSLRQLRGVSDIVVEVPFNLPKKIEYLP